MTILATRPVMGIQNPRLALIPDCYDNAYQEAVDLVVAYGAVPDRWQTLSMKAMLGELQNGRWAGTQVCCSIPRQNGKNFIIEMRELYGTVILGERILHTAHEVKTAMMHFRRMLEYFEHPDLKKLVKKVSNTNGSEGIWLHNGASIQFAARSKSSGRGFSVDVLVCDEAQELDDEKFAALLPTIAAAPNPQTILAGTPPGPTTNGEVFARLRDTALNNGSERLVWLEWSAENGIDLMSDEAVAQANPALGTRLSLEKIEDERNAMDEETFARERLGMWTGLASNSVFDMEHWDTLKSDIDPTDPVAFAIDVSPDLNMVSIGVAGYLGDATHVQVIENRKGTGWVIKRLKELQEKWNPVAIVVDQGSPAGSLIPELQAARIRVTQVGTSQVVQACGSFYNDVKNDRLLHANQPALNAAVQAATKRPVRDAFAWNRKNPNADITPLVAVTLAAHGLKSKRKPKGERTEAGRKVRLL